MMMCLASSHSATVLWSLDLSFLTRRSRRATAWTALDHEDKLVRRSDKQEHSNVCELRDLAFLTSGSPVQSCVSTSAEGGKCLSHKMLGPVNQLEVTRLSTFRPREA